MKFISIDPSLRNTAVVWGTIENDVLVPTDYKIAITQKNSDKKVRASSDLIARCRTLITEVSSIVNAFNPQIIFVETPSGSQSYHSAVSYAVSCALIASIIQPAIEITPIEVKKGTVGKKTASKEEMIEWAISTYPDFPFELKGGKPVKSRVEHVADAIAVAHVGIKNSQYIQLKKFYDYS